jgi:asparagine synthase (glutamine-hydrolysing)
MEAAGAEMSLPSLYFRRRRLLANAELAALGLDRDELGLDQYHLPPESEAGRTLYPDDPVASIGVLESRFYMGNMLLRDSDVFAMSHGLEIRVPLLDRKLSDLVYSLPGPTRLTANGPKKRLLAEALSGRLRPELLQLSKRGFSLPQARWLSGPLRPLFEGLLETTKQSGLVDPAGVSAVWEDFLDEPKRSTWSRAWMLGVLGSWLNARASHADSAPYRTTGEGVATGTDQNASISEISP